VGKVEAGDERAVSAKEVFMKRVPASPACLAMLLVIMLILPVLFRSAPGAGVAQASWRLRREVGAPDLARRVLDVYLGDRLEPRSEAEEAAEAESKAAPFIQIDPGTLDRYVGSFQIEEAPVVVSVMRIGDDLLGALCGEGMAFFYPVSETVFMNGNHRVSIESVPGAGGEFNRVRLDLEGQEMWADRIPGAPSEEVAREYTGRYYSDALGMVYSVRLEDGRLYLSHRRVGIEETGLLYAGGTTSPRASVSYISTGTRGAQSRASACGTNSSVKGGSVSIECEQRDRAETKELKQ
jgi:hypothetical protein